jgi:hypothetical protein
MSKLWHIIKLNMAGNKFSPEQFVLDPSVANFEINTEVACLLVNSLSSITTRDNGYIHDPLRHRIILDPTGKSENHAPLSTQINDLEYKSDIFENMAYRVSFKVARFEEANRLFLPAMLKTLSLSGRKPNLISSEKRALIATAGIGLFLGAGYTSKSYPFSDVSVATGEYTAASSAAVASVLLPISLRNRVREQAANSQTRLYNRRLKAAEKIAKKLNLPPIVRGTGRHLKAVA